MFPALMPWPMTGHIAKCQEQHQQCHPLQQLAILAINPVEQCCQKSFSVVNL
jgi:hypothetical protein